MGLKISDMPIKETLDEGDIVPIISAVSGAEKNYGFLLSALGVGTDIGLFTEAAGLSIPAAAELVQTSGYGAVGVGAALYFYDAAVNSAYVTAHPRVAFLAADGRGFRLDPGQRLTMEMFGAKADAGLPLSFDYRGSGFVSSAPAPVGATDNATAFATAMAYTTIRTSSSGSGGMHPLHFECNDNNKAYYTSETMVPQNAVHLKGTHPAGDGNAPGTIILFPPNTSGIIINHFNTAPAGVDHGASGSIIEGIFFYGGGGTTRTAHGLWQRAQCVVRDCSFACFAGNNTNNVGSVGQPTTGPLYGLTSGTLYERVMCYAAGNWNSWVDGSDVSASTFIDLHHKTSRLGGLIDTGYFNNQYVGYQNNEHGNGLKGACWYSGRNYALISNTAGIGSSTTPGADDDVWHDWGAAGAASAAYPAWSGAATYEMSLPIYATGAGTVIQAYTENYYLPSHIWLNALCFNNLPAATRTSNTLGPVVGGTSSSRSHQVIKNYSPNNSVVGASMRSGIGGSLNAISGHGRDSEGAGDYQHSYLTGGVLFNYGGPGSGYNPIYFYSTINSDKSFGRAAAVQHVFEPQTLSIGDSTGNVGTGRIVVTGTAAPTGDHTAGEIVFNKTPATGGHLAWSCWTGHATTPTFYKAGAIFIDASATYDPPSLATSGQTTTTVTCTGAALGDFAQASFSLDLQSLILTAYVSAANTVTVLLRNSTGGTIDLASGTLRVRVEKVA